MKFEAFIATFWPLLALHLAVLPATFALAWVLSQHQRRRDVRRLHLMRRS
jgi:hypothetical protein